MNERDNKTVRDLCNEVSYMNGEDVKRLRDKWRFKNQYETALPSLLELATELANERRIDLPTT